MVRPSTNCSPISRIAADTAVRITGSPSRRTMRAQRALDAALAFVEHLAGQHQRPGRGVDEDRTGAARMRRPVVRRDLVADQLVHRLGVGHAQQRLGQAHQRHALLGREAVGRKEHLHQRGSDEARTARTRSAACPEILARCSADSAACPTRRFSASSSAAGSWRASRRGSCPVRWSWRRPPIEDDCPVRFPLASGTPGDVARAPICADHRRRRDAPFELRDWH